MFRFKIKIWTWKSYAYALPFKNSIFRFKNLIFGFKSSKFGPKYSNFEKKYSTIEVQNSKSSGTTQCRLLQEYNLPMFLSPLRGLVGTTIYSAGYASLTHGYILLPLRGIVRVHFPFSFCIFSVEIYSLFCGTTQGRPLQVIKSIIISFTPPGLYIVCSLSGVALRLTPACNLPPLRGFVSVHFLFTFLCVFNFCLGLPCVGPW